MYVEEHFQHRGRRGMAQLQNGAFTHPFGKTPTVLVTATHREAEDLDWGVVSTTEDGSTAPGPFATRASGQSCHRGTKSKKQKAAAAAVAAACAM
jgi:hypothetical protein